MKLAFPARPNYVIIPRLFVNEWALALDPAPTHLDRCYRSLLRSVEHLTVIALPSGALLARVTLFAGARALPTRCMRGVLRVRLGRSSLSLGSVFRFGFCSRVLLMSGVAHCGGGVRFVGALCGLLFLFFFLLRFLDSGE